MRLFIIIILLYYSINSFSQVVVANDKMNILFFGVDNPIHFAANGYNNKNLILVASCGNLTGYGHEYIWKLCGKNSGRVKFSCFLKQKNKKKLLGTAEYRIKDAPNPRINFGSTPEERKNNDFGSSGVKFEFLKYGPRLNVETFDFNIEFIVKQYDVEICRKIGDTLRFKNTGQKLNENIMTEIKKLNEGDKIYIKNLIAYNTCEMIDRKLTETSCLIL